MGERTRLGLGVLGVALVLGGLGDLLLRATPWGINFLIWVTAIVGLAILLARWGRVGTGGEGEVAGIRRPRLRRRAGPARFSRGGTPGSLWSPDLTSPLPCGSDAAGASGAPASWITYSVGSTQAS